VLRIRDVYPRSRIKGQKDSGSRIRIKEFKYFLPKKLFLSFRKYDPGCSSQIRILIVYPSQIQVSKRPRITDPEVKKAPESGSRSPTLLTRIYCHCEMKRRHSSFCKIPPCRKPKIISYLHSSMFFIASGFFFFSCSSRF
jgi:hypothetical protein